MLAEHHVLIASIDSTLQEFITQGNTSLAEGNPTKLLPGIYGNGDKLIDANASAIKSFERALRLDPKNRDALYGRGLAYLNMYVLKDHAIVTQTLVMFPSTLLDTAINDLAQVTRMPSAKNFAPVYLELGRALLLNGNYSDSIQANVLALKKGTQQAWRAYSNIASAYYQLMRQNPSPPNGPKLFELAEKSWLQSITLAPNNWLAYKQLAEMHRYAYQEFGYPQASPQKADVYAQKAATLYQQTPQAQQERAREQRNQQWRQEEANREQQAQARLEAWKNRPCTSYGDPLRRHMCQEGYLNPQTVQGKDQPMPDGWQP
ncbi:tetratricopeptide repeat protein [Tolypothrix sp. LEGE 11397]|uniref:tetratricopeptide repeat protein n=1 Tax=Tolypothrix sp. LEGE 11397 TaxID=2777971 RepID=UPI0030D8F14D